MTESQPGAAGADQQPTLREDAMYAMGYQRGVKAGWNLCIEDDQEGFARTQASTEHVRVLLDSRCAPPAAAPAVQTELTDAGQRSYDYAMALAMDWGREEYARGRAGRAPSDHNPTLTKLAAALSPLRDAFGRAAPTQAPQQPVTGKPYLDGLIDRLLMPLPSMPERDVQRLMGEAANMLSMLGGQHANQPVAAGVLVPPVVLPPGGSLSESPRVTYTRGGAAPAAAARICTTCGLPATEFPCGHPCRQDTAGVALPAPMHPDCTAPDCDCEPGIECAARGAARGVKVPDGGEQQ